MTKKNKIIKSEESSLKSVEESENETIKIKSENHFKYQLRKHNEKSFFKFS